MGAQTQQHTLESGGCAEGYSLKRSITWRGSRYFSMAASPCCISCSSSSICSCRGRMAKSHGMRSVSVHVFRLSWRCDPQVALDQVCSAP